MKIVLRNERKIVLENFSSYGEISNHLKVDSPLPNTKNTPKVSIIFEDSEGQFLFNQICGSKLRNYVSRTNTKSMGAGNLKNLADLSKKLPELQTVIFIPDGDMAKTWFNKPINLVTLPGTERPETLIYRHLFKMRGSDPFWKKIGATYSRQFAILSKGGTSLDKGDDKGWVKNWYKQQSPYWGRGNQKAFKSWVQDNKPECLKFCKRFTKLLKGKYKGEIPKAIIDKVLAQFKDID